MPCTTRWTTAAHWTRCKSGLPDAPVTWVVVQKDSHDLVVSTYGRGLYILDDITPLEQLPGSIPMRRSSCLSRVRPIASARAPQAMLNFNLKAAPKEPVELEILDAHGRVVRKLEAKGQPGLNRVKWDMRYESPRLVALRTAAPDNPHIWNEPRFRDVDSRPITHWGSEPAEVGPIVAPGKYTVRLKVDGQSLHTAAYSRCAIPRRPVRRRHRLVGEDPAANYGQHQPRSPTRSTRSSGCASNSK